MIQIKDVAHYYIGQKCINTWFMKGHSNYNPGWILTGIDSSSVKPYKLETATHLSCTDSIKLILRRLEDLTEEEIKTFIGWEKLNGQYADVGFEKDKTGINIYYTIDADDYGSYPQNHRIDFCAFSPKEFHYLLKQGFDLWGLIESNQAIDAKTLNQNV